MRVGDVWIVAASLESDGVPVIGLLLVFREMRSIQAYGDHLEKHYSSPNQPITLRIDMDSDPSVLVYEIPVSNESLIIRIPSVSHEVMEYVEVALRDQSSIFIATSIST